MRFEAHPFRAMRFVPHETANDETQTVLSRMGEPQRAAGPVTNRESAPCPGVLSTAPPHA